MGLVPHYYFTYLTIVFMFIVLWLSRPFLGRGGGGGGARRGGLRPVWSSVYMGGGG